MQPFIVFGWCSNILFWIFILQTYWKLYIWTDRMQPWTDFSSLLFSYLVMWPIWQSWNNLWIMIMYIYCIHLDLQQKNNRCHVKYWNYNEGQIGREKEGRRGRGREKGRERGLWKHVIHLSKYRKLISKPWFLLIFQKY